MPTFHYPAAFAAEAARNLRQLAEDGELATTGPGASALLVDLRDAAEAMRQVIDRIASGNTIPGLPAAARAAGLQIGDELHQAGTALEETSARLTGAVTAIEQAATTEADGSEWVQVVSLHGPHMAAVFLSGGDLGMETDDEAVDQHATREHLPLTAGERAMSVDAYTIIANPGSERIAMYRALDDGPGPDILDAQDELAALLSASTAEETPVGQAPGLGGSEPARRRSQSAGRHTRDAEPAVSWFDPPVAGPGTGQGRGLGL